MKSSSTITSSSGSNAQTKIDKITRKKTTGQENYKSLFFYLLYSTLVLFLSFTKAEPSLHKIYIKTITKNLRQYGKTKNCLCMNFQIFLDFSIFFEIHTFSNQKIYLASIYGLFPFFFGPSKQKINKKISLLILVISKVNKSFFNFFPYYCL